MRRPEFVKYITYSPIAPSEDLIEQLVQAFDAGSLQWKKGMRGKRLWNYISKGGMPEGWLPSDWPAETCVRHGTQCTVMQLMAHLAFILPKTVKLYIWDVVDPITSNSVSTADLMAAFGSTSVDTWYISGNGVSYKDQLTFLRDIYLHSAIPDVAGVIAQKGWTIKWKSFDNEVAETFCKADLFGMDNTEATRARLAGIELV